MIKASDRDDKVVKWHFPTDKENPTVLNLRPVSGPKAAYLRFVKLNAQGSYEFDDWKTDKFTANIESVENYENKDGQIVTLKTPEEISRFIDSLTEVETFLLIAAIDRDGKAYNEGLVEKN